MKYKVDYEGFAYVEAENEEEARRYFLDDNIAYDEKGVTAIEEIDEFYVTL